MTALKTQDAATANGVPTHYKARRCLLCGSADLFLALPLAHSAVGNDYLPTAMPQQEFAQNLHLCRPCGNAQIEDVVRPDLLFGNYTYSTSSSLGLVEHFKKYASEVAVAAGAAPGSLVVDIGSNDGSLLKAFKALGYQVVGVDPAVEIARRATSEGVPTVPAFFTRKVAGQIRDEHGPAAVVTANNVFAHSDKLPDMADGIRDLLRPDGVFSFEVVYLLDILQASLWDTVYHEHLCHHSVRSLDGFFRRHGLELVDVRRIPSKGGSIRGTVQRAGGPRTVSPEVGRLLEWERLVGLHEPATWRAYSRRIEESAERVGDILDKARAAGKRVVGYGAAPAVTTLINQFRLAERMEFLVDDNPVKQGTYSPGHHLPVYPSAALYEKKADVAVVLAWTYAGPIVKRHQAFLDAGGRFVLPLPAVQVV